jgi:adenosylcobinamide kinase/adenosylcobinamide-phosphate guanylyltransferase
MAELTLILGGTRSGKTSFAQAAALRLTDNPIYVATARVWDGDFAARVARHKADRGPEWRSLECEKRLSELKLPRRSVVVVDCVTLWLTNFIIDADGDREQTLEESQREWEAFAAGPAKSAAHLIVVSNELGLGVHPPEELGRKFADVQGFTNQRLAASAQRVVLMVAGIPMYVKGDKAWLQA